MDKKILFSIIFGFLVLAECSLGLPVLAQLHSYGQDISITDVVTKIEAAIWIIFGAIAVICFVIAGILFLTAQGAPEKIKTARSAVIWGAAGVIVGIVAFSIVAIVTSLITETGGS